MFSGRPRGAAHLGDPPPALVATSWLLLCCFACSDDATGPSTPSTTDAAAEPGTGAPGSLTPTDAGNITEMDAALVIEAGSPSSDAGTSAAPDAAVEDPPWEPPAPARRAVPDCSGQPPSCASQSSGTCGDVLGCAFEGECTGLARSCVSEINQFICADIDGCYWSSVSSFCAGAPVPCTDYTGSSTCVAQLGCNWSTSCEGQPTSCSTLGASSCETQQGCTLDCGAELSLCGDQCVDLEDDEEHCGACDFGCGPRSDCREQICHCSAPYERCAGRCVDTRSDSAHCGACGRACADGMRCELGTCVDVDECLDNPCSDGRDCDNTVGGFECAPCPVGTTEQDEVSCVDIDECAVDNGGCDPVTICNNFYAGHSCGDCPVGYVGTGATGCDDIDECAVDDGGCDPLTTCENLPGSHRCSACPAGYTGTGLAGCDDVDECADSNPCGRRATCENAPGDYVCACKPYFTDRIAENLGCVDEHIQGIWEVGDVNVSGVVATVNEVFVLHSDFAPRVEKRSPAGVVIWGLESSHSAINAVSDGSGGLFATFVYASDFTLDGQVYPRPSSGRTLLLLHIDADGGQSIAGQWHGSFALNPSFLHRDAAGNLYLAGTFQGQLDLGTTILSSLGNLDTYLFETSDVGLTAWAFHAGEADRRTFATVEVVDPDRILLRYRKGTVAVNPASTTEHTLVELDGAGQSIASSSLPLDRVESSHTQASGQAFLVGSDASGFYWELVDTDGSTLTRVGWPKGSSYSDLLGFELDASGNPLVAGTFREPSLALGTPPLEAPDGYQSYLASFAPTGQYLWGIELSGGLQGMTRDPAGVVYLYGKFREPLPYATTLGPGTMGAVIKVQP